MAFGYFEGHTSERWTDRRSAVGEWKRSLLTGVVWCAVVCFAAGATVGLWLGGPMAYNLWQHREMPATLVLVVFIAAPWILYMGITGLTAFLAWDYRRDRWPSSPNGESWEGAVKEAREGRPVVGPRRVGWLLGRRTTDRHPMGDTPMTPGP